MSSNAFARSRPRVRHQRVPKTPSYAHPRFLKLVKELARIDEANKKLVEPTSAIDDNFICGNVKSAGANEESNTTNGQEDCSNPNNSPSAQQIIAQLNQSRHTHHHSHHHHHHHHHHNHSSRQPQQHIQQQQADIICCPGLNYSSCVNEANTSNGYRSLDFNQSSSALHDNYYRQSNNTDNQQQVASHIHHQSYPDHHQRHYSYPSNQQDSFTQSSRGMHLSSNADYCGLSKCPSSSSPAAASLGYSKSGVIQLSNAQVLNSDVDPRQDENRSKRKRSGNDAPSSAKKCSPSSGSPPACSKRHKSSPEPPRPLSPSFTKCPICLLDCMDRDPSFTNTCFHLFCFVCIENWSKSKATCPLCRTKFSKIIYNIRSESCFEEKIASPLRRDDDDDRFTYEQLSTHSMIHSRNSQAEETRLLFDNLRNNDVLMPHLVFTNQGDSRQVDLHSFNSIASNANFSSSVPHVPFAATSYNPVGSNYIALIPPNGRLQTNSTSSAITSAYPANTSLTNISSDTSNRTTRLSRSGRYSYSRSYDLANIDSSVRGSRSTSSNLNPPVLSVDSRHHHSSQNPSQHHQHHNHHHSQQRRSTIASVELEPARQSHHQNIPLPYQFPARHYTNPNVYTRRPYTNPPIDQHILDELYTQAPEM